MIHDTTVLIRGREVTLSLKKTTALIGRQGSGKTTILKSIAKALGDRATYYHIWPGAARLWRGVPGLMEWDDIKLDAEGYGTVNALAHLKEDHLEAFLDIQKKFTSAFPHVEEVLVSKHRLALRLKDGREVGLEEISDGAVRLLTILTVTSRPLAPEVVCLDGPEEGLHFNVLEKLARWLYETPCQVILATHSPDLVAWFDPEEVLVVWADVDGRVSVRPVTKAPHAAEWLEVLDPGEFWVLKGEEFILGRTKEDRPREGGPAKGGGSSPAAGQKGGADGQPA